MTLRQEFALGHSELNDFLYAVVGGEKNGAELTVLSLFARLDLDPWEEGARLSRLTKEAAIKSLVDAIASLPGADRTTPDTQSIAAALVDHLPRHLSSPAKPSMDKIISHKISQPDVQSEVRKWIVRAGLALTIAMVLWRLFGE